MRRCLFRILAALLLCGCAPLAFAQVEVNAGMTITRHSQTTGVGSVAWMPEWRTTGAGVLRGELGAVYIPGRNGSHLDLGDDVAVLHGGVRYEPHRYGLTMGFGIGVQVGRTVALSGNPQFVSTLGWRWDRFSLLARHISNASIREPNDGETMLVAAWRF